MGLLDKLLGRSAEAKGKPVELSQRIMESAVSPFIISRAIAEREYHLSQAVKIPLNDAAMTSGALVQLVPTLQAIWTKDKIGDGSLVRVVFPDGVKGNLALDKNGRALGSILKEGGGLAQSRLVPAIDPAALAAQAAMAGILMEINKKLNQIQKTQQQIMDFLEQDKLAGQRADLNTLIDILDGYQHNWDNALYCGNQHMKVLDIKQNAKKNFNFYQQQIQEQISAVHDKMSAPHRDKSVKEARVNLGKLFRNYRMALYIYSFASFLEVMLLGNFRQAYLDQVAAKVQEHDQRYQTQFSESYDIMKRYSLESWGTRIQEGIGKTEKAIGKVTSKRLQEKGEQRLKNNDKKATRAVAKFNKMKQTYSKKFVDSIRHVSAISNQTTDILFDGEALYLVMT